LLDNAAEAIRSSDRMAFCTALWLPDERRLYHAMIGALAHTVAGRTPVTKGMDVKRNDGRHPDTERVVLASMRPQGSRAINAP